MKRPVIGVVPLWDESRDSLWMLPGYMDGLTRAGGLPLLLPLITDEAALKQIADICAGFLFTGGHDLSPSLYGMEVSAFCDPVCEMGYATIQRTARRDLVSRYSRSVYKKHPVPPAAAAL